MGHYRLHGVSHLQPLRDGSRPRRSWACAHPLWQIPSYRAGWKGLLADATFAISHSRPEGCICAQHAGNVSRIGVADQIAGR